MARSGARFLMVCGTGSLTAGEREASVRQLLQGNFTLESVEDLGDGEGIAFWMSAR